MTTPYRDKELHDLICTYTKKAIALVSNYTKKASIPFSNKYFWQKQSNDTYVRVHGKFIEWSLICVKCENKLQELKEYNNCAKYLDENKTYSSQMNTLVGTKMSAFQWQSRNIINATLLKILRNNSEPVFDNDLFEKEYPLLESILINDYFEHERITPLYGFHSNEETIRLNDEIEIVKLSDDKIIDFLNKGFQIGYNLGINSGDFCSNTSTNAIKINFRLKKIIGESKERKKAIDQDIPHLNRNTELEVINSLRVFKKGPVYSLCSIGHTDEYFSEGYSFNHGQKLNIFDNKKYALNTNESKDFITFYNKVTKSEVKDKRFMQVAIDRFSRAIGRESPEDQIIDLLICAEALFLNELGNIQGELRYRLSHRAAFFIENEISERKKLFKFFKNLYDVRSNIVHGSEKKIKMPSKEDGEKFTLKEINEKSEYYLRKALIKAIELCLVPNAPKYLVDWDLIIFETSENNIESE